MPAPRGSQRTQVSHSSQVGQIRNALKTGTTYAVRREIVKLLLDHDAYTNIIDSKGSTPLHLAAWSGNTDIVKLLLNAHITCDVNLKVIIELN